MKDFINVSEVRELREDGFKNEVLNEYSNDDIRKVYKSIANYKNGNKVRVNILHRDYPGYADFDNKTVERKLRYNDELGFYVKFKGESIRVGFIGKWGGSRRGKGYNYHSVKECDVSLIELVSEEFEVGDDISE